MKVSCDIVMYFLFYYSFFNLEKIEFFKISVHSATRKIEFISLSG